MSGGTPPAGPGALRSTDRLLPPAGLGKSPVKKGVTFNLNNDDDDDDDLDDKLISQPIRDSCRYCTVSLTDEFRNLFIILILSSCVMLTYNYVDLYSALSF